ncbi:MAG TPA: hypothetical protein DD401_07305 [Prevotella sp.]|nr:hypothetical protein [Prevotella sp.]
MKKVYTTPRIKVMAMQADSSLFAGTITVTDKSGENLGIGGTPKETDPSTPIEADAKRFSIWEEE